ncbi:hypothetical protein RirG_197970 [Rhizophagus irregularis DAOM 197198w]|uniref:Protein kinase domain-containing protein n=2 Tax=Rhizophagus irregularis TaxID=588596 RepID=A0A015LUV3_RHIIW|nr:hypothetical protein RirG_197970 [Rhizophagus irregularis DAOM 197198w]
MSFQDDITCKTCGEIYTKIDYKWCEPCQINDLKQNFTNWTSDNNKIDELIQEMQLKIKNYDDMIVEWIPYNQLNDIKEIDKDDYSIICSAIWTDGPLKYNYDKIERKKMPNKKVALKYLVNSQNNIINEFLNEAKSYTIENDDHSNIITMYGISQNIDTKNYIMILQDCYCENCDKFFEDYIIKLYGISQNPDTKNYISILQDCYCEYCGKIYTDVKYKWCNPCQINNLKQNFANWTSGNEKIDELIHEMQLKIDKHNDVIVEWVPFNQFININKIGKDDSTPLYSAIWTDGLLEYNCDTMEQKRIPNKEVALKFLSNSQNNDITNEFLNEIKSYFAEYDKIIKIYGISQNPATKVYIIVLQNGYCEICNNIYKNMKYKWCKQCLINNLKQNFTNWTSENEKIDEFIQQMQLEVDKLNDTIIEWIPLNQFNNIKELYESNSATFVNGPLYYNYDKMEWERKPNEKVTLICLDNLQCTTDEFLNEIKTYIDEKRTKDCVIEISKRFSNNYGESHFNNNVVKVYGISQNQDSKDYIIVLQDWCCENCGKMYKDLSYKWCNSCQINNLKQNFVNWTSGNEIIDEVIQDMQLRIKKYNNTIVEWIPYNQFNNIKEIVQGDFATLYSANWMNGPLDYDYYKWKRIPNIKVALKYLHNSQDITEEFLNEQIKPYDIVIYEDDFTSNSPRIIGISQNPNTKNYVLVLENGSHCIKCGEIYTSIYFNWCESCQINNLKSNFANWTSGNEIIDKFSQGMQLEFENFSDIIFEWIPYNQFNNIIKMCKSDSALLYSAIWIDGPLGYIQNEWKRIPNKEVALKCLYNSQNITNKILNEETKFYSIKRSTLKIYGISQNPNTKDYILVIQDGSFCGECANIYTDTNRKLCKTCQINNLKKNFANWTSGNNQIDELIQKMQLKINRHYDNIVEWIPFNQFSEIKEIGKDDSANILYSAIRINDSFDCNKVKHGFTSQNNMKPNKVTLKYLSNLQNNNITNEFLVNKVESYFIEYNNIKIYGISQNPNTKDYILVCENGKHCENCGKMYKDYKDLIYDNWCKACQINSLKENFANWTSENKIIDELIQEMQLKIKNYDDIIIEWIPFDQFNDIEKIGKNDFTMLYSTIWMNGPLKYNQGEWNRMPNKKVTLKYVSNARNNIITDEFLNEVRSYSINMQNEDSSNLSYSTKSTSHDSINIVPEIYGISQNPNTKDYIIILGDCYCKKCGNQYTDMENEWCKSCQINYCI